MLYETDILVDVFGYIPQTQDGNPITVEADKTLTVPVPGGTAARIKGIYRANNITLKRG